MYLRNPRNPRPSSFFGKRYFVLCCFLFRVGHVSTAERANVFSGIWANENPSEIPGNYKRLVRVVQKGPKIRHKTTPISGSRTRPPLILSGFELRKSRTICWCARIRDRGCIRKPDFFLGTGRLE
jgi:hypothetical protein